MFRIVFGRPPHGFVRRAGPVVFLALAAVLEAQEPVPVRGRVEGRDGRPLKEATVEALGTYWSATSRADGAFELSLPPGAWRLRVSHIGHRADTLSIAVGNVRTEPLAIRLEAAPIELEGLSVWATRTPPLSQTVTPTTIRQVPPLGEADVFRAVVLLPGVSQPNDLKGRIHLAGGASDETGILLDGHPLQEPFHLLGLLGAFNVAALERADVMLHHLPPSMGGRLSGVVALETRRPSEEPEHEAVASLLSSSLTVSRSEMAGFDVLAAARLTYLDRVASLLGPNVPRLGFHDGIFRVGRSFGPDWRAEILGFRTGDVYTDPDLLAFPRYRPLSWGESLAGGRLTRVGSRWSFSGRASFNRATAHLDQRPALRTNFLRNQRDWGSGGVEFVRSAERWRARGGVSIDRRRNVQEWIARGLADEIFSPNTPAEYMGRESQTAIALFGEATGDWGRRWTSSMGGRLWRVAGEEYLAPGARLEFRPGGAWRFEAAVNRRHQFDTQLEEPVEGSISAPGFLLDQPRIADVAAVSADWRPGELSWGGTASAQLQAFGKRYSERTSLAGREPDGTLATDEQFPRFDRIEGYSVGAMASAKVAFGRSGIIQGSYTYQRVRERVEEDWSPTAWDAPHTLALFGSLPLGRSWSLSAVYQAHSGRATTPVLARILEPRPDYPIELRSRYLLGERNSIRVPAYHRLDVGARRSWKARDADWTLFAQVLNVLLRENPIDYDWQQYFAHARSSSGGRAGRSGLPILPSVGLEVRW